MYSSYTSFGDDTLASEIYEGEYIQLTPIEIELGSISSSSGSNSSSKTSIRSKEYIQVEENSKYCIWNDKNYYKYLYFYDVNKSLISVIDRLEDGELFKTPLGTKFLKFRTSTGNTQNDLSTKFYIYKSQTRPNKLDIGAHANYLFTNGYRFVEKLIDNDATLPVISIQRDAVDESGNEFTILEIKAPEVNPKEATLTLMRSNLPTGGAEFIDFTDMNYNSGRKCCIVVQKRGSNASLAPFDVCFNDGTGRIDTLRVHPDGMKTEITKDGLTVGGELVATIKVVQQMQAEITALKEENTRLTSMINSLSLGI